MNVLSLFGWAEQWRAVLKEMWIIPTRYFSSEIDPYAIKLSIDNFPDIVHIWNVSEVYYKQKTGWLYWEEWDEFVWEIDLLIGGPPCQDLSIAGKRAGLDGAKSSLFWEYVRILNEVKPKAFFMENIASMPLEAKETITKSLFGIEPIRIDSRLTSAQTRKRLYWMWVRQPDGTYKGIDVPQPEDVGILLKDILEDIPFDAVDKKGNPIWKPVPEKYLWIIEKKMNREKSLAITATYPRACPQDFFEKSNRQLVIGRFQIPHWNNIGWLYPLNKTCAVNANGDFPNNNKIVSEYKAKYYWRKLIVRECARAQNFPEWYKFDSVSDSRAYKAIGNSWEGKAIRHLWSYLIPLIN